ncbi:MAG: ParB/RepB/Spo0J family partition protein, partial [Bacteroidales bacterium]|nr:ParB/RepB/Spo0J family partition protein [Bacteroidales bacterium]
MTVEMFAKERASIREFGFIDPLTVRPSNGAYEIIDGEQRWQAGKAEGLASFPCIVLDVDDDTA